MSSFPKINLESEELLLELYEIHRENSQFNLGEYDQSLFEEFLKQDLIQKSDKPDFFSFTEHGLEFIKVIKNKQTRSSILKKMTIEDYVLAIHYLGLSNDENEDKTEDIVSMTELARYLGLSNSSISEYIRSIEKEGLVTVIPRKGVKLTQEGNELVLKLIEKRNFLFDFFHTILKIDSDLAEVESHVLEHNVSPILIERLKLLEFQLKKINFSLKIDE